MSLTRTFAVAAGGVFSAGVLYWVAIVLACGLLAAEVWAAYILIRKLRPFMKKNGSSRHYAVAAPLLYSAVPLPLQIVLLVLVICVAVMAVLLALLLALLRWRGYHVGLVDEVETVEETTEETVDAVEASCDEDAPIESEVLAEDAPETLPVAIPVYSSAYRGGEAPYAERRVVETYREVIKETIIERTSPATEELLRAIVELMKVNSVERAERMMEVERGQGERAPYAPTEDAEDAEFEDAAEDALDSAEETDETDASGDAVGDFFAADESIVGYDEDTGCFIVAHYRKSFEAKLIQAMPNVKKYYSEIKNALLGYEGTTSRISWTQDTFANDRTPIARINARRKVLDLYLALDPETLDPHIYRGRDVGEKKKYAETPFLFKVNSPRKLMLALELVQRTCEEHGLAPTDIERVEYEDVYPMESNEELVERGLIREYLREKKPNVTFEFAEASPADAEAPAEENAPADPTKPASFELAADETEEIAPVEESVRSTTTVTTTERVRTEISYADSDEITATETVRTTVSRNPIDVITAPEEEVVEEVVEEVIEEPVEETVEEPVEEVVEEPIEETVEEVVEEPVEEVVEEPIEEVVEEPIEEVVEEPIEEVVEEPIEETVEEPDEESAEELFAGILQSFFEDEADEEEEAAIPAGSFGTFDASEDEDDRPPFDGGVIVNAPEEVEEIEEIEEIEAIEDVEEIETAEEDEAAEDAEDAEDVEDAEVVAPTPSAKPVTGDDPTVAVVDAAIFDQHFEEGATIDLEALKRAGLVDQRVQTLRITGNGALKKSFTVEANHFTLGAIMAIGAADGNSVKV